MQRSHTLPPDWHVRVLVNKTASGRTVRKFVLIPNWVQGPRLLHIIAEALQLSPRTFLLTGGIGGQQDLTQITWQTPQ
eukprot:3209901-Prorocentrum_lima.AAC.1